MKSHEYFVNRSLWAISLIIFLCMSLLSQCRYTTLPSAPPRPCTMFQHQNRPLTAFRRSQKAGYIAIDELTQATIPLGIGGAYPDSMAYAQKLDQSPPCSFSGYDSPPSGLSYSGILPYYAQPQVSYGRNDSINSYHGEYIASAASRSPVSAGSSACFFPSQPGSHAQDAAVLYFNSSSSSERGASDPVLDPGTEELYIQVATNGSLRTMTVEERDNMEFGEVMIPTTAPPGLTGAAPFNEFAFTNEQRYLAAYWSWIHPLYPIVHKPTFSLDYSSPLLRAAMLALGAQMLQNGIDQNNARVIHDRCTKVLKRRTVNGSHTFRVCDMQAIFLTEVYAIFKARRPLLQLSNPFLEMYSCLANNHEALSEDTLREMGEAALYLDYEGPGSFDSGSHTDCAIKCRQRLLLACYILDQEHAAFFGRQRAACLAVPPLRLPFPRSQTFWDSTPKQQAEMVYRRVQCTQLPYYDQVFQAMRWTARGVERNGEVFDAFRSSLMLACIADPGNDVEGLGCMVEDEEGEPAITRALEQSPSTRMSYHLHMLCKNTPVRELLSVAGESWCMAGKLSSQSEYSTAQAIALDWAKGTTSDPHDRTAVHEAFKHARCILGIHRQSSGTGLLSQEWAVYLAAVVIWARSYVVSREPRRRPRLSIPRRSEPQRPAHELDEAVAAIVAGRKITLGAEEVQHVLLWAKARIERTDVPHNCGLTNGALDVLGKLATRGAEDGWFGA